MGNNDFFGRRGISQPDFRRVKTSTNLKLLSLLLLDSDMADTVAALSSHTTTQPFRLPTLPCIHWHILMDLSDTMGTSYVYIQVVQPLAVINLGPRGHDHYSS